MKRVLVFGATSAIAEATARRFAADGARLFLVARSAERLAAVAADLRLRGAAAVHTGVADLDAIDRHATLVAEAARALDGIDAVLIAFGTLGDQSRGENDAGAAAGELATNFVSPALLVHAVLPAMTRGVVAVIGSVAGDRGRQSNYVYGAAKGGLRVFVQGVAHRLAGSAVAIVLVEPGPTDTPMTSAMAKGGPLWSTAERVGRDIHRAMLRGRTAVLYTPWFWRWIMLVIRLLPDFVFHRTRL